MELLIVLLYLLPVFAVLAFLNALFRIARALESIAQSLNMKEKDKNLTGTTVDQEVGNS